MKRASTVQKKEERRASIVEHARAWIAQRSFDEIRLDDLARELDLVKGTLYLYFPTKQDLFASILVEEMEAWWEAAMAAPATGSPGNDLCRMLAERNLLIRLIASLHMTIEPGLSPEGLRRMKRWFRDFAEGASQDIEARYPGIEGSGFRLVMGMYALVVGISQLAFPPRNVRALIEKDDSLAPFRIDFESFLVQSVDSLYHGTARQC
ncbi:MAG: TetR family transcriptional regulator [Spirochaetia bacterium]|jgi:AcrR family transcriptional regulator